VREEVAIWERAELERLANWLDASALAMGRGFPDGLDAGDAAVLLASVFEGVYLLTAWVQGPGLADWESLRGEDSAGVAEAWIEHLFPLTTDEPRPSVRPAPPPEFRRPAMGAAKLRVLTAVADAASRPTDPNPDGPTPGRVVDLARLARSLGVTERRLYAVWPTTTAFNADVLDVVVRRAGAEADAFVSRAVEVCMAERFATYDHLMVSAFAGTIEACLSREPNPQFAIMLAFADSEVREPSVAVLLQWVQRLATSLLAVLGTAGMRPVDGLSLEQIGFGVFAMVLGLERMGALHPHLATATRTFDGREVPLLALLAYHGLRRNLTDAPLVPIPPDIANPAPPIDHL